jgi:hypothetical protein
MRAAPFQIEQKGGMGVGGGTATHAGMAYGDGMIVEDAEPGAEPTEDSNPVEDDDLVCDGCDASLTMVDEFTENELRHVLRTLLPCPHPASATAARLISLRLMAGCIPPRHAPGVRWCLNTRH